MNALRPRLYAFAFVATLKKVGGVKLSIWIWVVGFLLLVGALLLRWWWAAGLLLVALLVLRGIYRRARKNGYATFEPVAADISPADVAILPPHQEVSVRATGLFSAGEREHHVLLVGGVLWHIPVDEHAVMVEPSPGRFLYQFVQPQHTERVRAGTFLFGRDRFPGLEIVFFTDWSPKIDTSGIAYYVGGGFAAVKRLKRTIYIVFETEDDWLMVWKSFAERTSLLD